MKIRKFLSLLLALCLLTVAVVIPVTASEESTDSEVGFVYRCPQCGYGIDECTYEDGQLTITCPVCYYHGPYLGS